MATAEKFSANIEQYIGRIIRKAEGKKDAIWFDIIDRNVQLLRNMAYSREKTYKKEFPK
jgi:superfamily II DNA or RNA helicase